MHCWGNSEYITSASHSHDKEFNRSQESYKLGEREREREKERVDLIPFNRKVNRFIV